MFSREKFATKCGRGGDIGFLLEEEMMDGSVERGVRRQTFKKESVVCMFTIVSKLLTPFPPSAKLIN